MNVENYFFEGGLGEDEEGGGIDPHPGTAQPDLESGQHKPLAEEYIWTANDANANARVLYTRPQANERIEPHYFRRDFTLGAVPREGPSIREQVP